MNSSRVLWLSTRLTTTEYSLSESDGMGGVAIVGLVWGSSDAAVD